MARNKHPLERGFVGLDMLEQDGGRTSNRKVPASALSTSDGDGPAKAQIEAQDREIAERPQWPRGPVKTISRSPGQ
jgi:hypothetical protein